MRPTRREFLTIGGLASASALLASCAPPRSVVGPSAPEPWPRSADPAWRLLSRATFGPRAEELARVAEIGAEGWIEEQLAPEHIADLPARLRVRRLDTLTLDRSVIFDVEEQTIRRELQQATLLRAIYSQRQLLEVMVDFWSDHFNISTLKGDCAWLKPIDDREVIRPHALGSFRELLWASMRSPAMLIYLDNQENFAHSPNENYARELLELHTLGIAAGYTQQDVRETARCLTGWTVGARLRRGHFRFMPEQHDDGPKTLLGTLLPAAGGARDAERVCELILAHPATAHHIAWKLVRRFVADDPPPPLVTATAATFRRTQGDIKAMLRTILGAPELRAAPPRFKRPLHLVAGALRQLAATTDGGAPLLDLLSQMGQPLFQWPMPDGFPDETAAWSGNLLPRWQFALGLVGGTIPGTALDLAALRAAAGAGSVEAALEHVATLLLGTPLPGPAATALRAQLGPELDDATLQATLAVLLAAPHYQWR